MKTSQPQRPVSMRHRKIGGKVLNADRLSHALTVGTKPTTNRPWSVLLLHRKKVAIAAVAIILIGVATVTALRMHTDQVAREQSVIATKKQAVAKEKSIAAAAC